MDRQTIDDQHVVARYLADQLSDADREAFEAYCRENPEVYREIEAAARVKVGLGKLEESARLDALIAAPEAKPFLFRYAAAGAGVLVVGAAVVGAFVLMSTPMIGGSVAAVSGRFESALPLAASYEFIRMRDSTEIDQRVSLPAAPSAIELRVLPDAEDAAAYKATLSLDVDSGRKIAAKASGLVAAEDHYVSLFVKSEDLVPGTYSLVVEPENGKNEETAFRFVVSPPESL